jgi:hypothetical protein
MKAIVKDFKIIQDCCLDIKGVTVISGKNNNGKSSLFEAIRSACLGRKGDGFIRSGSGGCKVKLTDNSLDLQWERSKKESTFYVNDKPFTKTGSLPPEEYTKILGIKDIEFPKFKLSPNFACQFESLFLVGSSPIEAAAALSFLFSGEKFPELLKRVSKCVKDNKERLLGLEGSKNQLGDDLMALGTKFAEFDAIKDLFTLRSDIGAGIKFIEDCEGVIAFGEVLVADIKKHELDLALIQNKLGNFSEVSDDLIPNEALFGGVCFTGETIFNSLEQQLCNVMGIDSRLSALSSVTDVDFTKVNQILDGINYGENIVSEINKQNILVGSKERLYNILSDVDGGLVSLVSDAYRDIGFGGSLDANITAQIKLGEKLDDKLGEMEKSIKSVLEKIEVCPSCGQGVVGDSRVHLLEHIQ